MLLSLFCPSLVEDNQNVAFDDLGKLHRLGLVSKRVNEKHVFKGLKDQKC